MENVPSVPGFHARFRNIYVREIPAAEAKATLDKVAH
jgi:hypothetical protein